MSQNIEQGTSNAEIDTSSLPGSLFGIDPLCVAGREQNK
jgi:hypothetical protein